MADIGAPHALPRLKELVEFFEDAARKSNFLLVAVDSEFIPSRMDLDGERSFDEPERLFTIPVEGDSRRVIVEGQTLVWRCLFSNQ